MFRLVMLFPEVGRDSTFLSIAATMDVSGGTGRCCFFDAASKRLEFWPSAMACTIRSAARAHCGQSVVRVMEFNEYVRGQLAEALGPVNRWYCSQHHGCEITNPDTLLEYYIKHGGAETFAQTRRINSGRSACRVEEATS
jgi:hypothetical protein